MATPYEQMVSQIGSLYDSLRKFEEDMGQAANGAGDFPSEETLFDEVDVSELERHSTVNQQISSNFQNGASIDVIHMYFAVQREVALCRKLKSSFYTDALEEASVDVEYLDSAKYYRQGLIKGHQ